MDDIEFLAIEWGGSDVPLFIYVDPDDGDICFEFPECEDAKTLTDAEWLTVVKFIAKQRLRRQN